MSRLLTALAGAALGAAAIAAPVASSAAQSVDGLRTFRFGIQGGMAFPQGDESDFIDNGFLVGGTIDWRLVNRPFGLRLDVAYQRFDFSDEAKEALEFFGIAVDPVSIISGTGAVVLTIPTASAVRPYLLGGAGVYHLRQAYVVPDDFGDCSFDGGVVESRRARGGRIAPSASVAGGGARPSGVLAQRAQIDCSDSETKAGLHGGAGLSFPLGGIDGYVEARFHSVFTEESNTNFIPVVFGVRF